MAFEINTPVYVASVIHYAVFFDKIGRVYNGTSLVAYNEANWATYAQGAAASTAGKRWVSSLPAAIEVDTWEVYQRAGGTATLPPVDSLIASKEHVGWNGTTIMTPGDVPTALQNADALLTRDMSAVTGEAARSPLKALRRLRNKVSRDLTTGVVTVMKEDDTTADWTAVVTGDATATPIKMVDPA